MTIVTGLSLEDVLVTCREAAEVLSRDASPQVITAKRGSVPVEAGNSFGLFSDFARRLGLTVNRVKLAPGSGVTLAPFADARRR